MTGKRLDTRSLAAALLALARTEAEEPTSVTVQFGVRRHTDRGLFGGDGSFDERAEVWLHVE